MNIIKRNGIEAPFDTGKIINAVTKANEESVGLKLSQTQIAAIAETVTDACASLGRAPSVEEVQDMVEKQIMGLGAFDVAKHYITYRYTHELIRQANTTDDKIMSLLDLKNEELKQENSNKNPVLNSTQRDYMAGEVSKDLSERLLLPPDIVQAHKDGLIHFHDMDYFAQKMHNCDLINLDDMLQNGTVISGTQITKPHSFVTACNIASQIVAQVASNQYGGQTFTLAHLAPFVDVSRQRILKELREEYELTGEPIDDALLHKRAELRLKKEIATGIQTIQYQLLTLMTTNG